MREKELVLEPLIRWTSIANVNVNVKVHSIKLSAQMCTHLPSLMEVNVAGVVLLKHRIFGGARGD